MADRVKGDESRAKYKSFRKSRATLFRRRWTVSRSSCLRKIALHQLLD